MEVRIAGINIPVKKHTEIALTSIFGVGRSQAKKICVGASVAGDEKIQNLTDKDIEALRNEVERLTIEGELRRQIAMDIKRKMDIGCYAGFRHRRGLPLKARTKTNAKTRKKRRKKR
jgi:small subunit ribosomal protein S13